MQALLDVSKKALTQHTSAQLLFRKIVAYRHAVASISDPQLRFATPWNNLPSASQGTEDADVLNSVAEPPFQPATATSPQDQSNALTTEPGEVYFESRPCPLHRLKIYRKNDQGRPGVYCLCDTAINIPTAQPQNAVLQAMNGGALHFNIEFPLQEGGAQWWHGPWRAAGDALGFRWFELPGVPNPVNMRGSNGSQSMLCLAFRWGTTAYPNPATPPNLNPLTNQGSNPINNVNALPGNSLYQPYQAFPFSQAGSGTPTIPGAMFFQIWRLNGGRPINMGSFPVSLLGVSGADMNGKTYPANTAFFWLGACQVQNCSRSILPQLPVGWNIGAGGGSGNNAAYPANLYGPGPFGGASGAGVSGTNTPTMNVVAENFFQYPDKYMIVVGGDPALQLQNFTFSAMWEASCAYEEYRPADTEVGQTLVEGGLDKVLSANFDLAEVAEGQYEGGSLTFAEMHNVGDSDRLRIEAATQDGMFKAVLGYRDSYKDGKLVNGAHICHFPHDDKDFLKWRHIALVDWSQMPPVLLDMASPLLDERLPIIVAAHWQSIAGNGKASNSGVTTGQTGDLQWEMTTVRNRIVERKSTEQVVPRDDQAWTECARMFRDFRCGWSQTVHRKMFVNVKTGKRQKEAASIEELD